MIHLKKLIPDEPKRDGFFKGLKFDLFVDRIVKYVQDLHEQILECINVINSVDKTERKDGKDGRGIEYITLNENNSITFGLSDNTSITTDAIHIESTVDLSDYYTKSEIDDKGYLTEHQSLNGYATETWVTEQISQSGSFNPDLYYSKNDIDGMNLISTSNIDNYIPSSLPANGGNSATVNAHTVNSDVPANAKFTDTQADWDEVDTTSPAYINNKPTIPDTSNCIKKSQTAGFVKNDGTIDTNTYLTQHQDVTNKEDKVDVETLDNNNSFTAQVGKYYKVTGAGNGITITLTTPSSSTPAKVSNCIFLIDNTSGNSVTFQATSGSVYYSKGWATDAGKVYEVNALFNGTAWYLTQVEMEVQS